MRIPLYQVDAFTNRLFGGNPAAVCPLESWLPDTQLQAIAAENNLSETAYIVAADDAVDHDYHIRWFTPAVEVDLCGHATLASAWVVQQHLDRCRDEVRFDSRSGILGVSRDGDKLVLDFPVSDLKPVDADAALAAALGCEIETLYKDVDYMVVLPREDDVAALAPDMYKLRALDVRGVIVTAPGRNCDFVSRFFAPGSGIDEDPVTGSAHCALTPYWAQRLDKDELHARQISARGGELHCRLSGDRVLIGGQAVTYLQGSIEV